MDFPFDAPLEVWLIRLPVALVIVGLVVVGLIQWSNRRYERRNDALPPATDSNRADGGFRAAKESTGPVMAPRGPALVRRLVGDLLTIGGILVVAVVALAAVLVLLITLVSIFILGPGWELGPGD